MIATGRKTNGMDMTEGPIGLLLIRYAVPLLLGNLFQQMYNTIDSLVVGNFVGTGALAAVGSTANIINTLVRFFNGVSIGAGVVISQYYGGKDDASLHRAIETTIALTILCGVVFTAMGYYMTPYMLRLMSTPEDVLPHASLYLKIYFFGLSGLLFYNMGSGILRAVGDTRRPLLFLCFSSVLNIALDLIFVLAFEQGIAGVAYATIISQFISAVLIMWLLSKSRENYRLVWRDLCMDLSIVKKMLAVGLPTGIQQSLTAFSNVFAYSYINAFGSGCMAGWSCYTKIDQFILLPIQSMGNAATTFVGQNIGAKDVKRAKRGTKTALLLAIAVTVVVSGILWLVAPQMVFLFSREAEVLRYGTMFLRINLIFMPFCCFNQVFAGGLRGIGDAGAPMFYLLFAQVFCRQIYLFVISRLVPGSVAVIGMAFPMGWMLCAAMMSVHYMRLNWEKRIET